MKLSKFLLALSSVTLISILYVYQQTEIFRLAYVTKNKILLEDLLNKNSFLRYNIKNKTSLVHIGSKISQEAGFQMPESFRLVRWAPSKEGLRLKSAQPAQRETLLSRIFGIKREAEAKTVNP